ncbi:MAG: nitroreductase family protein [Candidatus Ozemobacteraceae bacterium]
MAFSYSKTIGIIFLAAFSMQWLVASFGQTSTQTMALDNPPESFQIDLAEAFKGRQSTRDYSSESVSPSELAKILWAANGVNRPNGKRTTPAPRGFNFITIYVCASQGISLYDPTANLLKPVSDKNIIPFVGKQPYVASASYVLAFVADLDLFTSDSPRQDKIGMGYATAGCIAQNVYLGCAALKCGTCFVWSQNESVLREALQLKESAIPLFIMPLGKLK